MASALARPSCGVFPFLRPFPLPSALPLPSLRSLCPLGLYPLHLLPLSALRSPLSAPLAFRSVIRAASAPHPRRIRGRCTAAYPLYPL